MIGQGRNLTVENADDLVCLFDLQIPGMDKAGSSAKLTRIHHP